MLLKPGEMFGDYRIIRLLGKGGMSEVWLLKLESRHGYCAVKLLDPAKASDHVARKRFLSEARLAMEIQHPHVIRVYDIGEDPETGLCYIIMEYAPNGTLEDLIRAQGRLPFSRAVKLVRDIAHLMEEIGPRGIVHRDLKPSNILFAVDGTFRIADLGTARVNAVGGQGASPALTSQLGAFIGTPAYMAPEQMIDPRGVDLRADIYSLGIVFFEMLTGKRPYADLSSVQIMAKAVTGAAIPDIRTVVPKMPSAVSELIRSMCEPKREQRADSPRWIVDCCNCLLEAYERKLG